MYKSCVESESAPLSGLQRASNVARERLERALIALGWGNERAARYVRKSLQTVWRWRNGLTPIPADRLELIWIRAFGSPVYQ